MHRIMTSAWWSLSRFCINVQFCKQNKFALQTSSFFLSLFFLFFTSPSAWKDVKLRRWSLSLKITFWAPTLVWREIFFFLQKLALIFVFWRMILRVTIKEAFCTDGLRQVTLPATSGQNALTRSVIFYALKFCELIKRVLLTQISR